MAIVTKNITRNTSTVARATFGTMLFIGSHRWFPERYRKYSSKEEALSDLPADSLEYAAANSAFSQSPRPEHVLIGRREASVTLAPVDVTENSKHTLTLTSTDNEQIVMAFTASAGETAESIVDAMKTAIESDSALSQRISTIKTGSGATTTLTLISLNDHWYTTTNTEGFKFYFDSNESAAEVKQAIDESNADYYAIMASDHTETFVLGMAAAMEGTDSKYFVGLQEITSISSAYSETSTDIAGKLATGNFSNTSMIWDDGADERFPEAALFAMNATYTPGNVVYVNNGLSGFTAAINPTTGNYLTSTEKNNLLARNVNFIDHDRRLGVDVVTPGKAASGEWIDDVVGSHALAARCVEAAGFYMVNLKGSKFGGEYGLGAITNVLRSACNPFLSDPETARLLESYELDVPNNKDILPQDRADRHLSIKIDGYYTGSFDKLTLNLNLQY